MKREYDFSKGERGEFFRSNSELNLPVYLDKEVLSFVQTIAKRKKCDVSVVVNRLIKSDMSLVESIS